MEAARRDDARAPVGSSVEAGEFTGRNCETSMRTGGSVRSPSGAGDATTVSQAPWLEAPKPAQSRRVTEEAV